MTLQLSLALWAEGPSDHTFLPRILFRATHEAVYRVAKYPVDVGEQFLRAEKVEKIGPRDERIFRAFAPVMQEETMAILFIHSDSDGDANAAIRNNIAPAIQRLKQRFVNARHAHIPVVPIHSTEAWAIADLPALKRVLGVTLSDVDLGVPEQLSNNPNFAESILDPRQILRDVNEAMANRRRGRRVPAGTPTIPAGLGDAVDLKILRQLAAFRTFEAALGEALGDLIAAQERSA